MQTAFSSANSPNAPTGNGVYERVKARIIANDLPAGKRILIEPLADQLFVSSTPVREALIRLSAENVVQGVPKSGFFVKEISETEIKDLYTLQHLLLDWSVKAIRTDDGRPGMLKPPNLCAGLSNDRDVPPHDAINLTNNLFIHLGRQTGNTDAIRIIENINDRTHYMRDRDFAFFNDTINAALRLCDLYHARKFDALSIELKTYFHDKSERLPDLIRAIRSALIKNSV